MKTDKRFWAGLIIFCLLIALICFFPLWFTSSKWFERFCGKGEIGDAIGGIMGPFIAIAAAILTFLAFWVQYEANKKLILDTAIQRFENRFFEMIRFHRENVKMVNGRDLTPRNDLFITMFFELKFIYNYTLNLSDALLNNNVLKEKLTNREIFNISYIIFFSGANPDTTRADNPIFGGIEVYNTLFSIVSDNLRKMRNDFRIAAGLKIMPEKEEGEYLLSLKHSENPENAHYDFTECKNEIYCFSKSNNNLSLKTENKQNAKKPIFFWLFKEPFTGHTNELGPYFQHLLETIKYLDGQDSKLFSYTEISKNKNAKDKFSIPESKYNYFKLLRAQLSAYELLLIYYHSLSILGDEWLNSHKKELLKKYKVLKKMPIYYADFYISPENTHMLGEKDQYENAMFDELKLPAKMTTLSKDRKIRN